MGNNPSICFGGSNPSSWSKFIMIGSEITNQELSALEQCRSIKEWKAIVLEILERRNGNYPFNWLQKVKLSGLMFKVMDRFCEKEEIEFDVNIEDIEDDGIDIDVEV